MIKGNNNVGKANQASGFLGRSLPGWTLSIFRSTH